MITLKVKTKEKQHIFTVELYLGTLPLHSIRVELFTESLPSTPPRIFVMKQLTTTSDKDFLLFTAMTPADIPAEHYTPRVVPYFSGVSIPQKEWHIAWVK